MSNTNKGYALVLNGYPYTNHKTLATARKAGDRLANSQPLGAQIEIWRAIDSNDALNLDQRYGIGWEKATRQLGLEPLEYWE